MITEQDIEFTNEMFVLFVTDIMEQKGISRYRISKDTGLTEQFFSNKFNGYSRSYVSLPTIVLLSLTYNINFDLLHYANRVKEMQQLSKTA